jgi:peptidoglycan/LPS O-acetylase OafA/YrhL
MTVQRTDMPFLNTCRWVSAALVAYGHIFLLVYPAFTLHENLAGAILVAMTRLRFIAVAVFFIVSGHLIGGGILKNLDTFSWPTYFVHRFTRIYTPLVPAIVLTVVLDHLAIGMGWNDFVYTNVWPTQVLDSIPFIHNYRVVNVISTTFSVETMLGRPLGSNGPLWSLGLEWCFYFIFPLTVLALRLRSLSSQIAGAALVAVLLWFVIGDFASNWLLWCAGALASRWLDTTKVRNGMSALALLVAAAALALGLTQGPTARLVLSIIFGIAFAVFLQNRAVMQISLGRIDKILADMSYSLYITHAPVAVFCVFIAMNFAGLQSTGYHSLALGAPLFAGIMVLTLLVAWGFSVGFESRTPRLRRYLQARLLSKPAQAHAVPSPTDVGGRTAGVDL